MGVFANSYISVGSGGLFMHASLNLLAIVVVFTEHVLTIVFIHVIVFISQDTAGLYLITCANNDLQSFSPYFSSFCSTKHNLLKYLNTMLCIYPGFINLEKLSFARNRKSLMFSQSLKKRMSYE